MLLLLQEFPINFIYMCAFKRIIWFGNSFLMTFFLHRKKLWRFCAGQGREIHAPTSFTFNFSFFLSLHIITFFFVYSNFFWKVKLPRKNTTTCFDHLFRVYMTSWSRKKLLFTYYYIVSCGNLTASHWKNLIHL